MITKQSNLIIHLPGLNGLRAIAALAVLISHITLGLDLYDLDNKLFGTDSSGNVRGLDLAGFGVTIFFTLSGFLITYLLLKEKEISEIDIRNFYYRRILRIWPLYYTYLAISVLVILAFDIKDYNFFSLCFYILLLANIPFILGEPLPLIGHYWSLGVEEQFYLFFPFIARLTQKRLLKISLFLILIILTIKVAFWLLRRYEGLTVPLLTINVTRYHTMLIGVIGAVYFYNSHRLFTYVCTHKLTQTMAWIAIGMIAFNRFHIASVIDQEIISVITVFLIMGQITEKKATHQSRKYGIRLPGQDIIRYLRYTPFGYIHLIENNDRITIRWIYRLFLGVYIKHHNKYNCCFFVL